MNLIPEIVSRQSELSEIRRDIHKHPELAYEEHRTADLVAEKLTYYGLATHRGLGQTGVVGILKSGDGNRAIGLRADMDALAMKELNEFRHKSITTGKMHGCGHDGHTTMLLGAAEYLAKKPEFNGIVYFIFQPAEEGARGADAMIKDGLFRKFPVETIWGMHNWPTLPVGQFMTRTGPFMACSDSIEVIIKGIGGHGALPHLTRSPVNTACAIIQALNEFVAHEINTQSPSTFTVGSIHGGDAINVIPDTVTFSGTVRSFSDKVRDQFEDGLQRIIQGICTAREVSAEAKYTRNYPPVVNTREETLIAAKAAAAIVGTENINTNSQQIMGSEDFAFMLQEKPGNYIMIGNGEDDHGGCMVHNPRYDFNDDILAIGASYWVELVKELLPQN